MSEKYTLPSYLSNFEVLRAISVYSSQSTAIAMHNDAIERAKDAIAQSNAAALDALDVIRANTVNNRGLPYFQRAAWDHALQNFDTETTFADRYYTFEKSHEKLQKLHTVTLSDRTPILVIGRNGDLRPNSNDGLVNMYRSRGKGVTNLVTGDRRSKAPLFSLTIPTIAIYGRGNHTSGHDVEFDMSDVMDAVITPQHARKAVEQRLVSKSHGDEKVRFIGVRAVNAAVGEAQTNPIIQRDNQEFASEMLAALKTLKAKRA